MRILLTGKTGQVGWELQRALVPLGEVVALDRNGMNLANPDSIRSAIRETKPELIVNAAAYTAVDQAESEPELAMAINGVAPGIIAEEAKRFGATLVHYSTDYVFDGTKDSPYTEADTPNPVSIYGKTKLAGERAIEAAGCAHLILRTSWVYGARGNNFLLTILRLAKERDELRIVDDQIGAPTWCRAIASATASVVSRFFEEPNAKQGVYHITCAGETSWCNFARAIVMCSYVSGARIVRISTDEYPLPARRPSNSSLSNSKLNSTFGIILPRWQAALDLCLDEMLVRLPRELKQSGA